MITRKGFHPSMITREVMQKELQDRCFDKKISKTLL
jgi:hypothetical protein